LFFPLSALEHCGNSFEEAAAWLLGDRDESDIGVDSPVEEEEEEVTTPECPDRGASFNLSGAQPQAQRTICRISLLN